jgi:ATPase subunit of ABC transporter with duplicated ATPase domains
VNLAKALWQKPKLLLLDEPTNHLDFHALLWLSEELQQYPHACVIVSHNAHFLSETCSRVLQIVNKSIQTLPMADLSLEKIANMQRQNEEGKKFTNWRFAYPECADPALHGLSFHHVSFSYSCAGPAVLSELDRDLLRFSGRSRTVLLGRNGSGKSTILKLCLGIETPTEGTVDRDGCLIGHYSQHFNEELDRHPEDSAATYLVRTCKSSLAKRIGRTDRQRLLEHATEVLSWFGLSRKEAADRSLADLSGGQKARVNFAYLSLNPAHLLFLDEPTNHLDANGMKHLVDAIEQFEGGIVLVSHDELLIRRLLESREHSSLLVCKDGSVSAPNSGGLHGLNDYRRAALREQYERSERAARAAEKRLQDSRRSGPRVPRGARRGRGTDASAASTREPSAASSEASQDPQAGKMAREEAPLSEAVVTGMAVVTSKNTGATLEDFFRKGAKKKPMGRNLNKLMKPG